ncbi:MAG TPA: Lsr2 family protein [Acidimicrobiales bacterium]
MAQKVEVILTCDLDDEDTPAAETVAFSYDGQAFEFELCAAHLDEFRRTMRRYADSARSGGSAARRRAARGGSARRPAREGSDPSELAAIRDWARNHGHQVSDRGRISAAVRAAYEAAQR